MLSQRKLRSAWYTVQMGHSRCSHFLAEYLGTVEPTATLQRPWSDRILAELDYFC